MTKDLPRMWARIRQRFLALLGMTTMKIQRISILGGAEWKEEEQTYKDCFETCKLLAQNGYAILNGGGPGVMKASTEGAHAGGGEVTAVTFYPNYPHPHYEGRDPKNLFDEEVVTSDYFARTKELLVMGQCHVVFKGGTGTISEFGMSWASSRIHQGHQIPLVLFGDFWNEVVESFRKHMYMRPEEFKLYTIVTSPQEVLAYIKSLE